MLIFFLLCLVVGAIAGFLAGLFGIGGGLIVVPALVYLLPLAGVPDQLLMSVALGTSFATIVITSASSAQRHHKLGNVLGFAVKFLAPAIMLSAFFCGLFIGNLPKQYTSKLFAGLVIYLAFKMIVSIKVKPTQKSLTPLSSIVGGILIGSASSFAGIGGGGFIVPFLNSRGIEMRQAIGSSAVCGALLGVSGMLSYIIGGWNAQGMPDYSLGYVYLPAIIGITAASIFTSKIGADMVTKLPVSVLKRAFAIFLIIMALNMIFKG